MVDKFGKEQPVKWNYEICLLVQGTPVSTDEIMRKLEKSVLIKQIIKEPKVNENIYKRRLKEVV